jgi:hypothetical protein
MICRIGTPDRALAQRIGRGLVNTLWGKINLIRRVLGCCAICGTAAVLALTGCAGGKPQSGQAARVVPLTADQVMDKVTQKTDQIKTYKSDFTIKSSADGGVHVRGRLLRQATPAALSWAFNEINVDGRRIPGVMKLTMIGDRSYLKLPRVSESSDGKPWMAVSALRKSGLELKHSPSRPTWSTCRQW